MDGSALAWYSALQSSSDDAEGLFLAGALALVFGFGLMFAAYRAFRFGEHYEYRRGGKPVAARIGELTDLGKQAKEAAQWLNRLN